MTGKPVIQQIDPVLLTEGENITSTLEVVNLIK